jgi:LPXTG-motif cell wall-anchored protein
MKRFAYLPLALALTLSGAAWAQGPTTSAPGPSLQREPQPANNDLRNPNSQAQTQGTATTTATDSTTTGTSDTTAATPTTPMTSAPADTGMSTDTTSTTTTTRTGRLPRTGSEMPLVGMMGLLALASALGVRTFAKRDV